MITFFRWKFIVRFLKLMASKLAQTKQLSARFGDTANQVTAFLNTLK